MYFSAMILNQPIQSNLHSAASVKKQQQQKNKAENMAFEVNFKAKNVILLL